MADYWDDAFNEVYTRNYLRLLKFAYRLTKNIHDAEELADEALLIYHHKRNEEDIKNPDAYLTTVMGNVMGNYFKSQRREKAISFEDLTNFPDHRAEHRPLIDILPSQLSPQEKEILILRYEQNLSYREISEILGLAEPSCRSRLFRAKAHCAELLEHEK